MKTQIDLISETKKQGDNQIKMLMDNLTQVENELKGLVK